MTQVILDKPRYLKFGFKAMMLIEKQLGKPLAKIDFTDVTFEQIAIMAYGGLSHEDKTLTLDKIVDLLDGLSEADFENFMTKMGEEMGESFGKNQQRAELDKVVK